jgi:uncharacterized RDD family membrane protein YckC
MPGDTGKASLLLRVIAKTIDVLLITAAAKLIPQVGYAGGILYLLISDGLFDGRSVGKKILKLKVISLSDGSAASFKDSTLRNITIAVALFLLNIPLIGWILSIIILLLESLLVLGNIEGMRLGDTLANTKVVED